MDEITKIIEKTQQEQSKFLGYEASRKVLGHLGIRLNETKLATSIEEAQKFAQEIGFPVVLKLVSKEVVHKTEVGGVRTHINTVEEVKTVYESMVQRALEAYPNAKIDGIMVEEQVSGSELFVGTTRDPHFGPMIAFGMGGIYVEVYKDISFRLIPISKQDAREMIEEIRGKSILDGVRGLPPVDREEIVDVLMRISDFIDAHPEVAEVDINPLVATAKGLTAIDARIVLN